MEAQITQGGYTGVLCNGGQDMPVIVGRKFTCTAAGGKLIDVTIVRPNGNYSWTPRTDTTASSPNPSVSGPSDLADELGCDFLEDAGEHAKYTSDQGTCGELTLYLFAGQSQRDLWLAGAPPSGGKLVVGPVWIVSAKDPTAAQTARAAVGGELR